MIPIRDKYVVTLVITCTCMAIYAAILLRAWWRMDPANRRAQTLNIWTLLPIMGFAQYFLAGYLFNMSQPEETWTRGVDPLVILYLSLTLVPGAIALLLRILKKKTPEFANQVRDLISQAGESRESAIHRDLVRKGTHVIQFLVIFAIDAIGFQVLTHLFPSGASIHEDHANFWGDGATNNVIFAWQWDEWAVNGVRFSDARVMFFAFFYVLFLFTLTSELCRRSGDWRFCFDGAVAKSLRPSENATIASYALFPAGWLLAAIFLPYFPAAGMLAGACLGDLASSQVGMRYGHHHFHHQNKTWEGWSAGIAITFVSALLFLGWAGALLFAGLFAIADFATEKPIPMSDNLLLPILGTIIFGFLQSTGVNLVQPLIVAFV